MQNNTVPRHQRPTRLPRFLFGAPYYPEHWSTEDRRQDARRMAEAGVNVVRMAEFAWDRMEPSPGEFDFSLFDETIAALAAHGIETILCTPTATPPRWLTARHQDWMRIDAEGHVMVHGSRQQACTNNPGFRTESRRITQAMADHFGSSPHVVGWQTDNEFYCHISECYCPACVAGFQGWLRNKYLDIASLNAAWGAAFWAQTYDDFEQIPLPYLERPTHPNPSQILDYYRFLSESLIEFQAQQVEILRAANTNWWITHNGMFKHVDYWRFTEALDFLSVDIYPGFAQDHPAKMVWAALKAEECRAVSGTFVVPEQQSGAGGQRTYLHQNPLPGQMRLWAYQSIAHGADGILHFRWRTARFGAEIYWNGVLDHDNVPRRRYQEFAQEGQELKHIGAKILGTVEWVRAAVLVEQDQEEAHAPMHLGLPGPAAQRAVAYQELLRRHLPAGLVDAADDFSGLDMILLPSFIVMDREMAAKLQAFVEKGGILVATARTATRDRNNHVIAQTPPGLLSDLFGLTVEEFGRLDEPIVNLQIGDDDCPVGEGYEILKLRGAEPLAHWSPTINGPPHGAPGEVAVAHHPVGQGSAIYIGTYLAEDNVAKLLELVLQHAPVEPLAQADDLVEITCRRSHQRRLLFILNHYPQSKTVACLPQGTDLLSGRPCMGQVELPAFGVAIVEEGN